MWNPAETCPKDGTEFLAWDASCEKFDVCRWCEELSRIEPVQYDSEYGPLDDEFGGANSKITHWMQLPQKPEAA